MAALATCRCLRKRPAPVAARARTFYNRKWSKRPSHIFKRSIHHCHRQTVIVVMLIEAVIATTRSLITTHYHHWRFLRPCNSTAACRSQEDKFQNLQQPHLFGIEWNEGADFPCQSGFIVAAGNIHIESCFGAGCAVTCSSVQLWTVRPHFTTFCQLATYLPVKCVFPDWALC